VVHQSPLILLNLDSLPSVTDRTEAEQKHLDRTFASESLILNVVYNLMSPVLNSFLNDFVKDGDKIIIQTYYPGGGKGPSKGPSDIPSAEYTATLNFASILEVRLLSS
jgi:hypothetical protein